jgi:hypothetical protein
MKLKVEQREDGWWVTGQPEGEWDCGPYSTRKEADEDRQGLERFFNIEEPQCI